MAFPANAADLEVCIAYGANLASDLTTLTYSPNLAATLVQPRVLITRGRIGGASRTQPTTIDLGLKNPGGIFSPRNIVGPNYGRLRRNTPIRVRLDPGTGMVTRAIGYMPDWPIRWTGPDIDDHIPMQASGALRRLGAGQDRQSALRRTIVARNGITPVAYWPVEDSRSGTTVASALPGVGPAATVLSGVTLGGAQVANSAGPSVAAAVTPELPNTLSFETVGNIIFQFPGHAITGAEILTFWVQGTPFVSAPSGAKTVTVGHRLLFRGAGGFGHADISLQGYDPTGGFSGGAGYTVRFYDSVGAYIDETFTLGLLPERSPFDGLWHEVQLRFVQSGPDVVFSLYIDGVLGIAALTMPSRTLSAMDSFVAGGRGGVYLNAASAYLTPYLAPYSIGHVSLHTTAPGSFYSAGLGYSGELAATRVARLCAEDGVTVDVAAGFTEPMGPQLPGTLPDLLRECEDSDAATLIERRTGVLGFDPIATRYNVAVAMTIPYLSVADLQPDDGDRDLRNYVTVQRIGGSSATNQRVVGPLGTDPATGVDRYPDTVSRSLALDSQAPHHASWIVKMSTVDEPRYVIELNLRAHPELVTQWLACDIGSRIQVTNPPAIQVGPAPADVIIEGYQEMLDGVEWYVTIYALPYRPYEVVRIQNGTGNRSRIAAGVSTTDVAYAADATSLSVTSASVRWIDSATYASKFPILVECAGEVMTCTSIANAVSDTFARTVSSGWGTADSGQVWTLGAGTAADFAVSGGLGTVTHTAVNATHNAILALSMADMDVMLDVASTVTAPTGGPLNRFFDARYIDSANHYRLNLAHNTDNTVTASLARILAGVTTTIAASVTVPGVAASNAATIRLQVVGSAVRCKVWITGQTEPGDWLLSVVDTQVVGVGGLRVSSFLAAGNTNGLPVTFRHDNLLDPSRQTFAVTRGLHGVSKALPITSQVQVWRAAAISL